MARRVRSKARLGMRRRTNKRLGRRTSDSDTCEGESARVQATTTAVCSAAFSRMRKHAALEEDAAVATGSSMLQHRASMRRRSKTRCMQHGGGEGREPTGPGGLTPRRLNAGEQIAAPDIVPCGIPCRLGYRAVWGTMPGGIPCRAGACGPPYNALKRGDGFDASVA